MICIWSLFFIMSACCSSWPCVNECWRFVCSHRFTGLSSYCTHTSFKCCICMLSVSKPLVELLGDDWTASQNNSRWSWMNFILYTGRQMHKHKRTFHILSCLTVSRARREHCTLSIIIMIQHGLADASRSNLFTSFCEVIWPKTTCGELLIAFMGSGTLVLLHFL